jgi:vitamin B12 transporter
LRVDRACLWVVCFIGVTVGCVANAQTLGTASGIVVDPLGGAITGARVTVKDSNGVVVGASTTDDAGRFLLSGLTSGTYHVDIARELFEPAQVSLNIASDATAPAVRVTMRIAGVVEDVVVTGRRAESRLSETPQKIEVITRDDIERSSALDLTDALKKNSTIDVAQYNGVISGIGIRGFRPEPEGLNRRSLVLIDGRPAGNTNLATLLLDSVERIEVQKGPSSALYGASAMGGVVNIITRQRRGPITGGVSAGYGSFNTYDVSGEAAGSLQTRAYFSAVAKRYDQQGNYTVGRNFTASDAARGERPFTTYSTDSATGKVGYSLSRHWTVEGNADYFRARGVQLPGSDQVTAIGTSSANLGRKNIDRHTTDVRLSGKFAAFAPSLVVYHAREQNEYSRVTSVSQADQPFLPFRFFANDLNYYGVQARGDWAWSRTHSLVFGVDYDHVSVASHSWLNSGTETAPFSPDNTRATTGTFAKNTFRLNGGRTIVDVGGRIDRVDASTLNSPLRPTFTGSETAFTQFSPSGGFKHELRPGWRLHATAGSGFVVPDAGALTGQTVSAVSASNGTLTSATIITGNPNLEPESSVTWDLGLDWSGDRGRIDLTYFDTHVHDRIVSSVANRNPNPSLCPRSTDDQPLSCSYFTYANADSSRMNGLELDTRVKATAVVQLFLTTNYYTRRADQLTTGTREIYNVPHYTIRAGVDYSVRRLSGRLSARSVGHQKANDYTRPGYPEITYPTFTVADASFRYEMARTQQLDLSISNLLDTNYYENKGYTLAGRSLMLRYRYGL